MKKQDKELFEFSMKKHNWDMYFYTYVRGSRVYLIKDELDTVDKGKIKYYKLMTAHYVLMAVLTVLLLKFIIFIFNSIFM